MAKKKRINVLLEELDIEIVQDEEALDGSNFSAALRKIIREWARTHSEKPVVVGGNGQ
jgi:predicted DNA binding CopG/RHH family protein